MENHTTDGQTKSVKDLFEDFIGEKTFVSKCRPATLKNYRQNFGLLLSFKPDLTLADITADTMRELFKFLDTRKRLVGKEMIEREYRPSSAATVHARLSTFFEWLEENGYLPAKTNPLKKMRKAPERYSDRRALNSEELRSVLHVVNTVIRWASLFIKKRNIAMIMMLLYTGVRKGELLGMKITDLDFRKRNIRVRAETSKSGRDREIAMHNDLVPYLNDYLSVRPTLGTEWLWVSERGNRGVTKEGIKYIVDRIKEVCGFNFHLHRCRHTFATNLYTQMSDPVTVQRTLGHREFRSTNTYLRSVSDQFVQSQVKKFRLE